MMNDVARCDPYLYETYVRNLFYDNSKKPRPKKYKIIDAVTNTNKTNATTLNYIDLGGCSGVQRVENIVESATTQSLVVFHPYSTTTTNKRIDFVYKVDGDPVVVCNCFQCVLGVLGRSHYTRSNQICRLAMDIMNAACMNTVVAWPRVKIFYVVLDQWLFQNITTNLVRDSKNARNQCKHRIGIESDLYLNWDKIVTVDILYVGPPKLSVPELMRTEITAFGVYHPKVLRYY